MLKPSFQHIAFVLLLRLSCPLSESSEKLDLSILMPQNIYMRMAIQFHRFISFTVF